ncbi:elongation factor 1-alpha-like [Aedes albopictus]|uniref:Uncharacterized protein n=1 Tax=Aedes albopictus TaxID=7160 RepID=A0ABM1YTG6_AEDAL
MPVVFAQLNSTSSIKSAETHHEALQVTVLEDLNLISVNNITDDFKDNPPKESVGFTSRVIVLDHPGQIDNKYTEEVDCHFTFIATKIAQTKKLLSHQSVQDAPPGVGRAILDRKQTAAANSTNSMNFMDATSDRLLDKYVRRAQTSSKPKFL